MNRTVFNDATGLSHTTLGLIKSDKNSTKEESTVEMSLKNFKLLFSLLPFKPTHNALNNEITTIKDKLTELTMQSNLSRKDIVDLLTAQAERQNFLSDVEIIHTEPLIVGKIDLNKV